MSIEINNSRKRKKTKRELDSDLIRIRKNECLELYMKGATQQAIADECHVSQATISLYLAEIRTKAREQLNNIIENELPLQWIKTRTAIQFMQREALEIFHKSTAPNIKLAALQAFGNAQREEFALISNSDVLDKCMKYVFDMRNNNNKPEQEIGVEERE